MIVDGDQIKPFNPQSIRERQILAESGIVIVSLPTGRGGKARPMPPHIEVRGIQDVDRFKSPLEQTIVRMCQRSKMPKNGAYSPKFMRSLEGTIAKTVEQKTGKQPIVVLMPGS